MFMPSNAGPAAVEVAESEPSRAMTISPLVPMSMNSTVPFCLSRREASTPEVMSGPT